MIIEKGISEKIDKSKYKITLYEKVFGTVAIEEEIVDRESGDSVGTGTNGPIIDSNLEQNSIEVDSDKKEAGK